MSENKVFNVIVSQLAEDDLNEIVEYYNSLSPAYVEEVISKFESNILMLSGFPRNGRVIPELHKQGIDRYREIIQGHYRIVYEVRESDVIIYAIIDSRQNFEDIIITKLTRILDK